MLSGACASAQAQSSYTTTRTSSFDYRADGLLQREVIEPEQAQQCLSTSYTYDGYGNRETATVEHCAGAAGLTQIASRTTRSTYAAATGYVGNPTGATVPVPAGAFATSALNALEHGETRAYDPRFGAVVRLTGPNSLNTDWAVDGFGRKTFERLADGTGTAVYHCWLSVSFNGVAISTASNSPGCHNGSTPRIAPPVTGETPADAVRYEHSLPVDASNNPIGGFTRVYYDRAGRKLRTVANAYDGTSQPGGSTRLVVQDTDYNAQGVAVVATAPYYLDSGSSTSGGSNDAGLTRTDYDTLGRATTVYSSDPTIAGATAGDPQRQSGGSQSNVTFGNRGTRQASITTLEYSALVTVTLDDRGHTRKEEKNPEGKTVRVTDASGSDRHSGAQIVHQHDAFGNLVQTKDALGNLIRIGYDLRGRKLQLDDPDAGVTTYCYDALGQLKAQQSSNQRGSHTPVGETACPSASGAGSTAPVVAGWTTLAYDLLGRMTQRVEPEYTSSWTYDNCNKGVGKLCASGTSHGISRTLAYDHLGRPQGSRMDVAGGPSVASAVGYDPATGRVATQTYPSGVQLGYQYTTRGHLAAVTLQTAATLNPRPATPGGTPGPSASLPAGSVLWSATAVNAWGRSEQHGYGNGVNTRAVYEPHSGRLLDLTAGPGTSGSASTSVVHQRYSWDSLNRLTVRVDGLSDGSGTEVLDTYAYDRLGRLTEYMVSGGSGGGGSRTVTLVYNALGMLLSKSDVGNYSYPAQGVANGRPHAVQSVGGSSYQYDLNGNAITASAGLPGQKWRSIAYTSFNLPGNSGGDQGIAGEGGSPRRVWQYDENHQRIKELHTGPQGTRTTWSLHPDNQGGLGFEREIAADGTQSNRHYLSAGGMAFAVLVTTGPLPSLSAGQTAPAVLTSVTAVKLEYWHKDHLGSLVASTDHAGAVTARYAYDPFGKRRHTNASYDPFGTIVVDWSTTTNHGTDRGYTGHEHLDDLGLIHMNGRVFDPLLARFLQADPFIQSPDNLQNYDRYAYCFNNPLTCTDPSGHISLKQFARMAVALAAAIYVPQLATQWFYAGAAASATSATSFAVADVLGAGLTTLGSVSAGAAGGFAAGAIMSGTLKGGLQGAVSGGLFGAASTVGAATSVERALAHGAAGCLEGVMSGSGCGRSAVSAAAAKFLGANFGHSKDPLAEGIKYTIIGGTASVLGGGKFENGATTAAWGYLFNECMRTRMCGSDSTKVTVSGNRVIGNMAHTEIQISSGYDFVVLEGQPGYSNGNGRLESRSNGANRGEAFSIDLGPNDGRTMAQFAGDLQTAARSYGNNLTYSFPSIRFGFNNLNGGYNSNSYVGGVLDAAAPGAGLRQAVGLAAGGQGFRVPGMENPIPLSPVR